MYVITGVATISQEEAVVSSYFDWPIIANDKDFANGLRKFDW